MTTVQLRLQIENVPADELRMATDLLAEGMRNDSIHVREFGTDPTRRQRRLQYFRRMLVGHVQSHGALLGACVDGDLIGASGTMAPRIA